MSRHRNVQREDWDDGYDDDDYYDDYYDEEEDDYYDDDVPLVRPQAKPVSPSKTPKKKETPAPKASPVSSSSSSQKQPKQPQQQQQQQSKTTAAKSPSISPSLTPSLASKVQHTPARHKELLENAQQRLAAAQNPSAAGAGAGKYSVKGQISVVVIGHVDAGKSTTLGHMMQLLGKVSAQQMHRLQSESAAQGKGSFAFAWVLDEHAEERERGVTVDVAVTNFETPKLNVTLLDAPGHRDFIPNMISGTTQADAAILVVSAANGEFEAGFSRSGQTREHMALAKSLGVKQLIVAVNQMDRVDWSVERYRQVATAVRSYSKSLGFPQIANDPILDVDKVSKSPSPTEMRTVSPAPGAAAAAQQQTAAFGVRCVPISGLLGTNLVKNEQAELLEWYHGPTLLELIDSFQLPTRDVEQPLRLCVSDICKTQFGLTIGGRIETGVLGVKDRVLVMPTAEIAVVKSISINQTDVNFACAGDNVDVVITQIESYMINIGSILCDPSDPIPVVSRFTARILTFRLDFPLFPGQQCDFQGHNTSCAAVVSRLNALLDSATGEPRKLRPRNVFKEGTLVDIDITLSRPLCLDTAENMRGLGRFSLLTGGYLMAAGIITRLLPSSSSGSSSSK